jgi:hypothetical protein
MTREILAIYILFFPMALQSKVVDSLAYQNQQAVFD